VIEMDPDDLFVRGDWTIPGSLIREQIEWAQRTRHASCYFQRFTNMAHCIVAIVDLFNEKYPTMSVTNDAEFVVRKAVDTQGDHPIIYRDTEGQWDEMRHREGNFACFRALDTKDFEEAFHKVIALHEQDALKYKTT
jgi:hypothetical protein